MKTVAQIGIQRIGSPRHRRAGLVVDRISVPIVDVTTGKLRTDTLRAQRIARRVARATMRQSFDKVGAAIPLGALFRIGLIGVVTKEQQFPSRNSEPLVEREGKLIFA